MARKSLYLFLLPLLILLTGCMTEEDPKQRPNIIIILADDMGFSDIGSFGAEIIETPTLDRLAEEGLRMTQFYNAARCCPSRASLLTGLYPHQAGMGSMSDQFINFDSYTGHLPGDAVTIADILGQAGYDTYISGKWHVGHDEEYWPREKGFDHCFSFIQGATSYFDNLPYRNSEWPWSDGRVFTVLDDGIYDWPDTMAYATDLYTEYAIRYCNMSHKSGNPFFLYLAYTAPHWPLHAMPEDIEKYRDKFLVGWDALRDMRYRNQIAEGIIDRNILLSERDPSVPAWDSLSPDEQRHQADLMAVYAAMVDRMDQNIGRLLAVLEKNGQLGNTVIFFLSDNGASRADRVPYLHERFSREAPVGTPESFTAYGPGWANVSNTPFRLFKANVHEGGIATPFVAWGPGKVTGIGASPGRIDHTPAHIIDLMPTCLSLAGAKYPTEYKGRKITPSPGLDLTPVLEGDSLRRHRPLFFEHHGGEAIRKDPYKLVRKAGDSWELFRIDTDRTETRDLLPEADQDQISDLLGDYYSWCIASGVFPQDMVKKRTQVGR